MTRHAEARTRSIRRSLLIVLTIFNSAPIVAHEPASQPTTIRIGAVWHDISGDFSSAKDGREPTKLDLDDFGIDSSDVDRFFSATIPIGSRWVLRLDNFGYQRDGGREAEFAFEFDDLVVPVGARVDVDASLWLYVANLSYRVFRSDGIELQVGAGAHVAQLNYELDGRVRVGEVEGDLGEEDSEYWLPLPNLYAALRYEATPRTELMLGTGWLGMGYQEYEGDLFFIRASMEYRVTERFGVGIAGSYMDVNIERDTDRKHETYDLQMPGISLYLVARL